MRFVSETTGMKQLALARESLRKAVSTYEINAKDCGTCETRGVCCTDVHFVNVRITRLETKAIASVVKTLTEETRLNVLRNISLSAETLNDIGSPDFEMQFYSCPLFDKAVGCTVHEVKPGACIHHACYENRTDLPPTEVLKEYEREVLDLNKRVYGRDSMPLPIPIALSLALENSGLPDSAADDCEG
jgi:Fe-S-cluster containining protein